ncbi:MAG: SDR family oxidoreductase [Alkalispirochaeta sp.]
METNKVAVVAGGSGGVGEGIVCALIYHGYRVYVPTRSGDHSERLRDYVEDADELILIPADLSDEAQVTTFRDQIVAEEGHIDSVIVSVGSFYYGYSMHRMPRTDWNRTIQDNVHTHFNLQRTFIEQLRAQNSGSYIVLIGPEADSIHPDEPVVSIMVSAQKMMARVIAQEAFDSLLRVYAITAQTTIHTRSREGQNNPDWIPARDLGTYIVELIGGHVPGVHHTEHEIRNRDHLNALLQQVT